MLVSDNASGTCRSRMAVRYVTRLVLKHRILVFKLDFKLDLLQMTLNFMLLKDSCIRLIRVRSKVIILSINHFQPSSRPSCQWKPNFKQRFHQIHSVHIVLQLIRHDLITGLLVLLGQNYGIQYLVKTHGF